MQNPRRLLTREPVKNVTTNVPSNCSEAVSMCATELMNAAVSFHKLHLKITGSGSYSAHKALNEIYDALPGHADTLVEGYQGACLSLISYSECAPKVLTTVESGIAYAMELKNMINDLQKVMPYSEIVNDLDLVKSNLNSLMYKLKFLM